jgi:hypothetical protein
MTAIRPHAENGRVVLDEPLNVPDGTPLNIVPVNDGDDLDDEERAELHAALDEAEDDVAAGRVVTEDEVWARLRAIR